MIYKDFFDGLKFEWSSKIIFLLSLIARIIGLTTFINRQSLYLKKYKLLGI